MNNRSLITSGISTIVLLTLVGCGINGQVINLTKNTTSSAIPQNAVQSSANSSSIKTVSNNTTTTPKSSLDTVQVLEQFIRSQYKTPSQYVKAYAESLSYRTGTIARAFLTSSIKNQIANGPIGATPWINKWDISLISQNQKKDKYIYKIKAYQPVSLNQNPVLAFTSVVTVSRYSDEGWIISNQQIKFRKGLSLN